MITDFLLDLVFGVADWMLSLLPMSGLSAEADGFGAWGLVVENMAALNYWLPISEVVTAVLAVFYVVPIFLGFTLVNWVYKTVRGGGGT